MNRLSHTKKLFISILFCSALFLFILSFSISLPIYCRQFYYAHIDCLELQKVSGFTKVQITEAYDAVLDYLTIPGKEFSTGVMKHSLEGQMHFADCKALFTLNSTVLLISAICILILYILKKAKKIGSFLIGKRHASFYSALAAVFIPIIIGVLAAINFDEAFEIFHKLFFPGKENWIFDPATDEIILVLPQEFFMNCAILISAAILIFSGLLLLYQLCKKRTDTV